MADADAPKNKGGRPTKYRPEFVKQTEKLCKLGATDQQLADFFEVKVLAIHQWKLVHPEFSEATKIGKDICDDRVERSLYQRAMGYEQEEVKIFMPAGATEPVYAPYTAKIAPDVTACIFWLKNRRKMEWRDKQDVDLGASEGFAALLEGIYAKRTAAKPGGGGKLA